eukprot:jgi/Chrzof1/3392/Cz12g23210.t1
MVSFLQKVSAEVPQPEHLGCIRVLVVGNCNVGKTAVTELIASGKPPQRIKSTTGCQVSVKLIDLRGQSVHSSSPLGQHNFFVELWDISGNPTYQSLRQLFYKQINGVILVYDLSDKGSLRRLPKWATEVATEGSFVAPLSDDLASRNIGGLPVPVFIVGNKADRVKGGSQSYCSTKVASELCSGLFQRAGLRHRRAKSGISLPDIENSIKGVNTSALTGQIDWNAVHDFFHTLWARRYQPATINSQQFLQHVPVAPQRPMSPDGDAGDGRLDDDWV